jgi:DNA repair protein RadC
MPVAVNCNGVPDVALLETLVGKRAAKRLYKGKLGPLFDGGDEAHGKCAAAKELVKRWLNEQMQARDALTSPAAVRDYLRIHFAGRQYESFVVIFLDAQNRVIGVEELFRGTLTQTSVYPREVVKAALKHNAAGTIFSHNHPSGIAEPSIQDQALTRTLAEALALIDVRVLDHMIAAGPNVMSFAERGLL